MRNTIVLEKDWTFYKNPQSESGEAVTLPHTWNAVDGQDGGNDYYRGTCKYVRHFAKPELEKGGRAYLEFNGAAMTADVVVNGTKLFHHEGGFSTFRVDVTEQLTEDNLLEVYVDNSDNTKVYPQKADFTFYGGLYRMVKLVTVPKVHFVMDYAGGNGMKVTPEVTILDAAEKQADADVTVELWMTGEAPDVTVTVAGETQTVPVENGYAKAVFALKNVHLWDGVEDPYLYTVKAELPGGDVVERTFGCRSFKMDPKEGFFLNGRSYPLRGVSRHQDRAGAGNALTYEMHREDMAIVRELGANTIRLAHYQHAQEFYDSQAGGCFDDYLRGWIGTSKSYPRGVIHFAPAVIMEQFDRGFDALQMFARLEGTGGDTVIRGFCRLWEERIGAILSASLGGKD